MRSKRKKTLFDSKYNILSTAHPTAQHIQHFSRKSWQRSTAMDVYYFICWQNGKLWIMKSLKCLWFLEFHFICFTECLMIIMRENLIQKNVKMFYLCFTFDCKTWILHLILSRMTIRSLSIIIWYRSLIFWSLSASAIFQNIMFLIFIVVLCSVSKNRLQISIGINSLTCTNLIICYRKYFCSEFRIHAICWWKSWDIPGRAETYN